MNSDGHHRVLLSYGENALNTEGLLAERRELEGLLLKRDQNTQRSYITLLLSFCDIFGPQTLWQIQFLYTHKYRRNRPSFLLSSWADLFGWSNLSTVA